MGQSVSKEIQERWNTQVQALMHMIRTTIRDTCDARRRETVETIKDEFRRSNVHIEQVYKILETAQTVPQPDTQLSARVENELFNQDVWNNAGLGTCEPPIKIYAVLSGVIVLLLALSIMFSVLWRIEKAKKRFRRTSSFRPRSILKKPPSPDNVSLSSIRTLY
ncbi:hypothetical protein 4 [Beihai barnacle virus 7]|uniref:Uncharacterized protein n=1 Tax=Beihai barnacle virus 7 TaxID=1922365 RepID=A0A1L3KMY2_9RHAB|nr:hypothetical protein 4 [Beihai barnacle virus 7]APG78665.1 hypothetical protein 4 [Beihai barnacle virus 7]